MPYLIKLWLFNGFLWIRCRKRAYDEKAYPPFRYSLYISIFSYLSYLPFKTTLRDLKHLDYNIVMHEHPQLLNEVTVQGERGISYLDATPLKSLPKGLYSFGGFVADGKICSRNMYIYDIEKDTILTKALKLTPRTCHAAHLYNNKIFILGGKRYSTSHKMEYTDATVEIYDMLRDTLYVDPVNPHQAVDFTSFIYKENFQTRFIRSISRPVYGMRWKTRSRQSIAAGRMVY